MWRKREHAPVQIVRALELCRDFPRAEGEKASNRGGKHARCGITLTVPARVRDAKIVSTLDSPKTLRGKQSFMMLDYR